MRIIILAIGLTLFSSAGMAQTAKAPANTDANTPAVATPDTTNPNAPVAGANSFTMEQAREKILKAGFTDVSGLKKDDQGIWRGEATKGGKSTGVALDFQGNVVGQ
jgi:hypothetical protein